MILYYTGPAGGAGKTLTKVQVFLTTASVSPWVVPNGFVSLVSIEAVGSGGAGDNVGNSAGGGGGRYCKWLAATTILNLSTAMVVGAPFQFVVGAGGQTVSNNGDGNPSIFDTAGTGFKADFGKGAVLSIPGAGGSSNLGGVAPDVAFNGGSGALAGTNGGGGGGAGGPNGPGGNAVTTTGGSADGGTVAGATISNPGNSGTEFDATHGCGSGAGGAGGTPGGQYGGGSGGLTNTVGGDGLIVITYNVQT